MWQKWITTGSVPRKVIPLRFESAIHQESESNQPWPNIFGQAHRTLCPFGIMLMLT